MTASEIEGIVNNIRHIQDKLGKVKSSTAVTICILLVAIIRLLGDIEPN